MIESIRTLAEASGHAWSDIAVQQLSSYAPDHDFWYNPAGSVGSGGYTGRFVSEETALRASAVYACIRVISETLASLPFNVYRRLPNGGKEVAYDHPNHYIIHDSPNEELTSFEFWEMQTARALTWGNTVSKIETNSKGFVESLIAYHPSSVDIERDKETGVRFFRVRPSNGGEPEVLMEDQVLHIPGLMWDGTKGYSPIALMREPIALFLAVEEYQGRFFGNNAIPGGYISHPASLSDRAKENLKRSWEAVHKGLKGAHSFGVLDEGMKIESTGVKFQEAQFHELRKFQVEEIARIFRVPLHLIQSLDRATNNNIEHQSIDFVTHTILPWAKRIEKRVNKALFGPREAQTYFAEFVLEGLLRGDAASRAAFYTAMRNSGIMTANEIRSKENLNPVEGGDELLIQGAMVPVSMAGQQQQQPKEAA